MSFISYEGKNIILTGASSGIGLEIGRILSSLGAKIIMCGRDKDKLENIIKDLKGEGHKAIEIDLSKLCSIRSIITEQITDLKIHGFVHSAGIEMTKPIKFLNIEDLNKVFDINFTSGIEIAKTISEKKYLTITGSSIVFISSIMSVLGQPGKVGYSASKGALISACRSLALELVSKNIRVNSISPGMVKTKMSQELMDTLSEQSRLEIEAMHPLGVGMPIEVANAVAFLLSDRAKWITGTNMIVDGGYSAR